MANLSQQKLDNLLSFLQTLRQQHTDDESLIALGEIEKEITAKKFGLVWEEHEEAVDVQMRTHIPVFSEDSSRTVIGNPNSQHFNFLLEGDNLHSLRLLSKTHRRRFDVIYIDPPYNTGATDWKYNNDYVEKKDLFRHSKWLSMMYARLKIAQKLLKEDGVFICAIDENELGTTLLLLEEVFGEGYKIDPITVVHNPRGVQGDNFSYVNEYAIFVYRKGYKVIGETTVEEDEIDWSPLRNWGTESERSDARNCFYPIYVKDGEIVGFGDVTPNEIHPQQTEYDEETGTFAVYPIDVKGIERKWRYARQSVEGIAHLLRAKQTATGYDIEIGKNYAPYRTVWTDKRFDANEYGSQIIASMVPNNDFDFPKSLYTVYECLYAVLQNRDNALVLDFFAGSGTTGHAVLLLNKVFGKNHSFILCTNNAVGDKKEKAFKKEHGAIDENSEEWHEWVERYGIASSVTYPRIKAAILGYTHRKDFKTTLYQKKITPSVLKKPDKVLAEIEKITATFRNDYDEIKMTIESDTVVLTGIVKKGSEIEGLAGNLMYYKTDFVDKTSEDLADDLLEHIREMIQLEYGVQVDNQQYVIILDDEEMAEFEQNISDYPNLKAIFVNSDLLLTGSQEMLLQTIKSYTIPDYYFDFELREAGEIW